MQESVDFGELSDKAIKKNKENKKDKKPSQNKGNNPVIGGMSFEQAQAIISMLPKKTKIIITLAIFMLMYGLVSSIYDLYKLIIWLI